MESKIRVLTDKTIDQIAAGEVIENPASVVKELVENSIDAKATSLKIEIYGGGHYQIRVIDNGIGLTADDAYLAFERHATSKIGQVGDLMTLSSMGFRGEALASIASCSKVEMITRKESLDVGIKIVVHGSKMFKHEPCARKKGTTIDVSALFYNIPARKAFQKSKAQSTNEVVKMVTKLALAHPTIAIELISHDQVLLKTSGDPDLVVKEVLSKEFANEIRCVKTTLNDCTLTGVISTPLNTRKNRTGQYIFINGRPIVSPLIAKCVQEAYGTRLSTREYPLFVLWFEVPPYLIDVNVHPQKSEVRFRNEEMIQHLIADGIANVFGKIESFEMPEFEASSQSSRSYTNGSQANREQTSSLQTSYPRAFSEPTISYEVSLNTTLDKKPEITTLATFTHFAIIRFEKGCPLFKGEEGEEKLAFVDLQSAQKRIYFDEILTTLESEKEIAKQQMLFTETLEFSPDESIEVKEKLPLLNKMGIGIREFGEHTFIVESLSDHIPMQKVRDIVHETSKKMSNETLGKNLLSSYPKRSSFSQSEVTLIINKLIKSSDPSHTPSGNRIMKLFTTDQFGDWIAKHS